MTQHEEQEREGDPSLEGAGKKEEGDQRKGTDPADHRAADDQSLGMDGSAHLNLPVILGGKTERAEHHGKLPLRGSKTRIEQERTAEGEGSGRRIARLLFGKAPVVPKLRGPGRRELRRGEKRAVGGEGLERMP